MIDVGRATSWLPTGDTVHLDFHHRNMLRAGERIVAVVDWEGCTYGDRVFDLITFCFGFTHVTGPHGMAQRIWTRAAELGSPERLTAYVAHMALRRVDWSIRHYGTNEVEGSPRSGGCAPASPGLSGDLDHSS